MDSQAEKDAFYEGSNGKTYTGSSDEGRRAYEKGIRTRDEGIRTAAGIENFLSLLWDIIIYLRPVYVFLVMYSPFIALGYITAGYCWEHFFGISLQIFVSDWKQILLSLTGISYFGYIYFIIFEYMRGHMVENQKHNGHWRTYYLFFTVIRVMIPPIAAMIGICFILGNKAYPNETRNVYELLIFGLGFTVVSFIIFGYKVSRKVNLFQPGGWAFNLGSQNNPYRRGKIAPRVRKVHGHIFSIMSFMSFYVGCIFILNLVICLLLLGNSWSFTHAAINQQPLPILVINIPITWLCWMYAKNRAIFFYDYDINKFLSQRFLFRLFIASGLIFVVLIFGIPDGYKTLASIGSCFSLLTLCYLMLKNKINYA